MKETPQSKHFCQSCQEVGKTNLRNRKWRGNFILNQETKHFALSFPFSRKKLKKSLKGDLSTFFLPQNLKKWTISIPFCTNCPSKRCVNFPWYWAFKKNLLLHTCQSHFLTTKSHHAPEILLDILWLWNPLTEIYRGSQIKFSLK